MKNKIFALLLIITILSITVYARGYLPPGAKVTFGDAVEVCCTGSGLVDNCRMNETCTSDVFCAGYNDTQNAEIIKMFKSR